MHLRNIFYHLHDWYLNLSYISLFICVTTTQIQFDNLRNEKPEYTNDFLEYFGMEIAENMDEISEDQIDNLFRMISEQIQNISFENIGLCWHFDIICNGSDLYTYFISKRTKQEQSALDLSIPEVNNVFENYIALVEKLVQKIISTLCNISLLWDALDSYDASLNEYLQAILMDMPLFDSKNLHQILETFINIHFLSSKLYKYLVGLQIILQETNSNILKVLNDFYSTECERENTKKKLNDLNKKIIDVIKNCNLNDRQKIFFVGTFHYADINEMIFDSEIQFLKHKLLQGYDRHTNDTNRTINSNTLSNPDERLYRDNTSYINFENSINSILNNLKICATNYLEFLNTIKTTQNITNYPETIITEIENSYAYQISKTQNILCNPQ